MAAQIEELHRLYEASFGRFVGALTAVVGDTHVAEECVQTAFARAVSHASSFRGGSLGAWVWRAAINAAVDVRRRELRVVSLDAAPWDALAGMPDLELPATIDPAVADALRSLSPRRRLVVFLRYYADLTQPEIAAALGASEGTVAATLSQARAVLRVSLESKIGGKR